jgi:hypothetical protein
VFVLFSAVPPSGALSRSALAPYPGSPPRPFLTARPPPSRGGAGPAVPLPVLLRWACGGSSGLLCVCGLSCCQFRLWLFSGAVPRGCSTLLLLPLPSPWLTPRAGSILVCSCTCLLRVCFPAGGPVCQGVAMCVFANHPCFAAHRPPSLFRRVRDGWQTFPFFRGPHVCWPARHTVVCVPRFLSVGFLFGELVPSTSHCRIPCLSGATYCRPVGFLASPPQVLRWAFV